ncbi:xanthine permease [Bacillus sp. AFS076308]|uniref:nucleobase:cation symporter-2 family protein n=1 Tax=unclassified Bacillus (in: firmicutes) TaxID=185979 RepID=UPI000BF32634|nr:MULTISPECIES: nucleobase:cation symporter-2 family protein [unclassified Bacillus (in: firmicutes)]PFN96162.1 xanthine permease [Bacillus sp. AFS076308]PGV56048.1 xanthine permease [Bacillus sp. AFS037270]
MKQGPWKTASLGIQHVLAMYAGAVIVPLIIGGALHLSGKQLAYLVSLDILTSGIATLLQVWQNRYFGIGLPIVLGCTFTAVGPIIAIGGQYGMSAIYGSILVSGIIVILIASFFGKLVRFFPPVVTGSVVTIIGITLIPVAMNNVAGGQGSPDFGSVTNLCLAFGTLLFIIVLYRFFKGFIRSISILLGLIAGTIAAALLGKVDFSAVGAASWFHMVAPLHFAVPTFELAPIITMTLVAIVSLVESTGVYFALSDITGRKLTEQDLVKGYRAEGLASIVGALFNSFPYTTYSQNVGLVQFSGVKSKNVIYTMAGILIFLGFVPKIAALTTVVPTSVLGGAMVAMFGMVIASGIKMLSKVDFSSQENLLIIACSVAVGLGVTAVPNLFDALPESVKILTNSGIVAGSLTAILLNLIFNVAKPKQQSQAVNNNNQSVA